MDTYDRLCFFIINEIISLRQIKLFDIAKKFQWEDKPFSMQKNESNRFYTKKSIKIKNKLKDLEKEGIVVIERKGGNIVGFNLDRDRIIRKRINLPDKNGERLFVKRRDGAWVIFY